MLQISPDSRYADVMEQALYNTVLSGMALDGRSFFYVNPLSVNPVACRRDERLRHVKHVRQKWFGCACCPPNIARLASSVAQYAYTENADTLFTHLYVAGSVSKAFADGTLTMDMLAGIPWEGDVKAVIRAEKPVKATLAFRLPGWSDAPCVVCEGKQQTVKDGYAYLTGEWQDGDEIALHMPMPVRIWSADERVRENIGQVAFTRGPVTFCAEEADNGENLHLLRVADLDASRVIVEKDETFGHSTVRLIVNGRRVVPQAGGLYRAAAAPVEDDARIILVPYYAWANRGEGEMKVWLRS